MPLVGSLRTQKTARVNAAVNAAAELSRNTAAEDSISH